jgi:hypothetical protein
MLGQPIVGRIVFRLLLFVVFVLITGIDVYGVEYLVDVTRFGAVADAKRVGLTWVGTDNSKAFNKATAYARKNGMTIYVPKGNYGVASTVWLTNPGLDGLRQAALTIVGSNRGAFGNQEYSANICVLKGFKPGKMVRVKKRDGKEAEEPYLPSVLGISNGRQVHIEGIGILGGNQDDLICGVVIGNISQMTSIRFCSISNIYAGIVFPGIRPDPNESVIEGDNDLLVVEQSYLRNTYNIVCAGTQPFACEYRSSAFRCTKSVFTGKLITDEYGDSRGSHKFSSNLFGTGPDAKGQEVVYFDLAFNEITIDSCHFEPGYAPVTPQVLIREYPNGGVSKRSQHLAFTNNIINFRNMSENPDKYRPLFDTLIGNRMVIQGNNFMVGAATRIKAYGAVLIGNVFKLHGPHDLKIVDDKHLFVGSPGDIRRGLYDFNHFISKDSEVKISLPDGTLLKSEVDYEVKKDLNAFEITKAGKQKIDKAKSTHVLISYTANDASHIGFEAWGGNQLDPPHGWRSTDLTMIANKVIGKTDGGQFYESELHTKYELPINK